MKTILARVTRNVKEDPSIPKTNIWNVETVFLEKLPAEEVSLVPDPKKTGCNKFLVRSWIRREAFSPFVRGADHLSKNVTLYRRASVKLLTNLLEFASNEG
jgi:hypothetical protein